MLEVVSQWFNVSAVISSQRSQSVMPFAMRSCSCGQCIQSTIWRAWKQSWQGSVPSCSWQQCRTPVQIIEEVSQIPKETSLDKDWLAWLLFRGGYWNCNFFKDLVEEEWVLDHRKCRSTWNSSLWLPWSRPSLHRWWGRSRSLLSLECKSKSKVSIFILSP